MKSLFQGPKDQHRSENIRAREREGEKLITLSRLGCYRVFSARVWMRHKRTSYTRGVAATDLISARGPAAAGSRSPAARRAPRPAPRTPHTPPRAPISPPAPSLYNNNMQIRIRSFWTSYRLIPKICCLSKGFNQVCNEGATIQESYCVELSMVTRPDDVLFSRNNPSSVL